MPRPNAETATPTELAWSKVTSAVAKAKTRPTVAACDAVTEALAAYRAEIAKEFLSAAPEATRK